MSSDCFHPNPLVHSGSSQELRMVPALDPSTAPVDGRGMDELILFLEKYSLLLNYYDEKNLVNGNWKPFIAQDLSTLLASISVSKYDDCLNTYYKYYKKIQNESVLNPLRIYVKILFDISFTLIDQVRRWNEKLILKTPAKEMIFQEISSRLAYDLRDLLQYYQLAQPGFVNKTFVIQPGAEHYLPLDTEKIILNDFGAEWWAKFNPADVITSWTNYKTIYLPANPSTKNIFNNSTLTGTDNIQYSSSYLRTTFTNIYNSYARIITSTKQYFLDSISNYPYHRAHNGLMLAFLKLFGVTQNELNRLTDRHLNFYYKDVLRIYRKPPVPDSAHLVFTLAKNIPPYILDAGTKLLAGKDKTGKEIIYKTDESITINNSAVGALKSVFIDDNVVSGGIFAAEISNSMDGKGKDLNPDDPSWFAFGSTQANLPEEARSMTEVDTGFLIASPVLQLSEGERIVTMECIVSSFGGASFTAGELAGNLDLSFTGKKDWVPLQLVTSSDITQPSAIKIDVPGNKIIIKFTLDEKTGAVLPFDPSVHKAEYATPWPIVKCLFRKSADVALYRKLSGISISSININVKVNKAFSCIIHNDQGGLDAKNPFMPFGPRPKKNAAFYFGSHEVFSKKLSSLTMHLQWLGLSEGNSLYQHYYYKNNTNDKNYLDIAKDNNFAFTVAGAVKNGQDISKDPVPVSLFSSNNQQSVSTTQTLVFSALLGDSESSMDPFTEYSPSLRRGFLKLTLITPAKAFGHSEFSKVFTEQVLAVNDDSGKNSLPGEPYTPLLKPIIYDYIADETITVGAGMKKEKGQFFHLFPFGHAVQDDGSGIKLMPAFTDVDKSGVYHNLQGAFFIGIKDIQPGQILNLYIEFSEGSEDASLDPPGVFYSYMADNSWQKLNNYILSDSTNAFLGSGIIKLTIPENMNKDNTAMPKGLRWIRLGVPGLFSSYPKAYAVFTNAMRVTFEDHGNETSHLSAPQKAGTISKLVNSLAEIKKVTQPYDSFDGRMQEQDKIYYTRVSERLRHKNRAITIWDYERLTLEQFPFLYKAKCLNHTNDVTETAPGCVRLIAVPDMSRKSTGNLFEPRISNNKRKKIKDYLAALNCPFADLQVQNPQYEAIKVKCEVRIREGLDVTAHIEKLKTDIDRFLAPWAFDESRGIDFGGAMHRSQIIYFMEKLPYVDFVTDFFMDLYINNVLKVFNTDEVKATTSKSILTTYRLHQVGTNVCAS